MNLLLIIGGELGTRCHNGTDTFKTEHSMSIEQLNQNRPIADNNQE